MRRPQEARCFGSLGSSLYRDCVFWYNKLIIGLKCCRERSGKAVVMKKELFEALRKVFFVFALFLTGVFFIGLSASADEEEVQVDNGIPVIYLNIDETRGTIEEMIASVDHSVYCYGTATLTVPEGFHYSDYPDVDLEGFTDLEMSIRGRGNSSWRKSKKPFKIKLDKKTSVLGFGKNKHWVLVANISDESLIRDRITAWLGNEMGFAFTPRGVPVDVVMTGQEFGTQYLGSYYLSENVRVDDNRLDIEELEEDDVDPKIITGGYLVQNASQLRAGSPDRFFTTRGAEWGTHTPSFDTEEEALLSDAPSEEDDREEAFSGNEQGDAYENNVQQEYIQNYIQYFEDVLFEEGTAYRELMDVESAAKYWLVNVVTKNNDAFATGSTYIYKDRDPEDGVAKLYWGPLWDFDYAWDYSPIYEGMDYGHLWMKPMFRDKEEGGFVQEVYKQWPVMRELLLKLIEEGGIIDQYAAETEASAKFDALMLHSDEDFDYLAAVEKLKTWIRNRIAWLDENFDMVEGLVRKVDFVVDGEVWLSVLLGDGNYCDETLERAEKEGYIFLGWADEEGTYYDNWMPITRDTILTAQYISESEATHGEDIIFPRDEVAIAYSVHLRSYDIPYTVIPEDAIDQRIEWSSSDESFATVDELGQVTIYGAGTATFTAKLKFGQTRTFMLTVTEGKPPFAEAIKLKTDKLTMTVGEQAGLPFVTDPSPAWVDEYSYESEDPGIVTAGDNGVLTAVAPGKTRVLLKVFISAADGSQTTLEAYAEVTVEEKASEETTVPEEETSTEPEIHTMETLTRPGADEPQDAPDKPVLRNGKHWGWFVLIGAGAAALIIVAVLLLKKKRKES